MRNLLFTLCAALCLPGNVLAGMEPPVRVWQVAKVRVPVPGAPKYSDVTVRSLHPRPAKPGEPYDTLGMARDFHITRLEWVYSLDRSFVQKAKALGLTVGGALEDETPDAQGSRLAGRVTGKDGRPKKHEWFSEGRWVGCANAPEFLAATLDLGKQNVDAGVDVMQQDDPQMALRCVPPLCYCKYCAAAFVKYQEEHGPGADYEQFQKDSILAFHRELHQRLDAYAGRHIPFSNNNHIGGHEELGWTTPAFDFINAETSGQSVHPAVIYRKVQLAGGMPLVFQYRETSVERNRRALAAFYAAGATMMLPWDVYLAANARYFGAVEDYADLSGFIRANAQYLDGYENAAVAGRGLHETRYGPTPPLKLAGGSGEVYAFARARPGQANAAVVIHLVQWAARAKPFSLRLRTANFTTGRGLRAALRAPVPYDSALHRKAQETGDFAALAVETRVPAVAEGESVVMPIPALGPWAILVVEPQKD